MKILLYGLGRSGLAAGRLAGRQGHDLVWFDRRDVGPDMEAARAAGWTRVTDVMAAHADLCIAAPGVPIDHPDLAGLRAAGTETIGEVEWVRRTIDAPLIGVTGTAGKGTVTRWIEHFLQAAGMDAVAGGNLDPALAAVAQPGRWLIAEMSSFQLERCPTLQLRAAVVTQLGRDHLDRHGDVDRYHAIKRRLVEATTPDGLAVLNAADPVQRRWAEEGAAKRIALYAARPDTPSVAETDLDGAVRDGRFVVFGNDVGPVDALAFRGVHQRANLLAAATAAYDLGVAPDVIAGEIPRLVVAPGRHETVAERCGVTFVDDSIATRELAVAAALEAARPPVAWIVGGRDKGADPTPLETLVEQRVAFVVGIGETGPDIVERFASAVPGTHVDARDGRDAMRSAVRQAAETLQRADGGTVLLAPLAASFDQFDDYADRGRAFRAAVDALLEEAPWTDCS